MDEDFHRDKQKSVVKSKGKQYFINKIDGGFVILSPFLPRELVNTEKAILAIIIIVTILGAFLYFSLRWIFGPIKILSGAVQQISKGNFDGEINISRNDELGDLAQSINEMKNNISSMIKAKHSLLIDVSHELRSPLTRIKLAAEFIDDEKIKDKIKDDIREMEAMITELLETYRTENFHEKLNLSETDIVELVKNIVSKFTQVKINFQTEFISKLILIDKDKIEIAIRNIIDNAIKYSNGNPVDVKIYDDKETTSVLIKDKGKGIDKNELDKIFEPFYRIDKSRDKKIGGYGLGLSLVKKILDMHQAVIRINSIPSVGTEFQISFLKN